MNIMHDRKLLLGTILCGLVASVPSFSQPSLPQANWDEWKFLMGEWVGEGGGGPGQGSGGFTYSLDLQKRILVRNNYAEYPATNDRPAFRHDDLMIAYQEPGKPTRAEYFDNEGHVIHYTVTFSEDRNSVVFVSDSSAAEPRFRLTYAKEGKDKLTIIFDIAPPGKGDAFRQYIKASAHRKK
jgi:hypothetical protein